MTTLSPLSWIKQIRSNTAACEKVPLWGSMSPTFPLDKLSETIRSLFHLSNFNLTISQYQEIAPLEVLTPFGENPKLLFFQLSPLPGYLVWILSTESVQQLCSALLSEQTIKGLSDPRLQEGFYHFLLLQISSAIQDLQIYRDMRIQWLDPKDLPKEPAVCIDLSLNVNTSTLLGRLLIPGEFQAAFSEHFSQGKFDYTTSPSYPVVEVPLSLEIGKSMLTKPDLDSLRIGDLLLLDECSYDPETEKGSATLSLAEKPCFIVKIKKNSLKILDFALYHGDTHTMDDTNPTSSEKDPSTALHFEELEEESALPDSKDLEDEEPLASTSLDETAPPTVAPPESLTSSLNIPFPVVVEVAQIKMNLEKLLQLTPGNILELAVHPNQGVYLTVHGKKIARGELVKIGDVLGVKIIDLPTT